MRRELVMAALQAAMAGDWQRAHAIVQQDEQDPLACWLHAVLHKQEGDDWNSRYWYRRSAHHFEEWSDSRAELEAIRTELEIHR